MSTWGIFASLDSLQYSKIIFALCPSPKQKDWTKPDYTEDPEDPVCVGGGEGGTGMANSLIHTSKASNGERVWPCQLSVSNPFGVDLAPSCPGPENPDWL